MDDNMEQEIEEMQKEKADARNNKAQNPNEVKVRAKDGAYDSVDNAEPREQQGRVEQQEMRETD